ncbi:MAG: endonuclease/exonuclease/phosphatase family protein [Rudanella sp.]|nr:endonuclease/exonuclease/phosphatase family protein [Rudanella sp.]
MPTRFSVRLLVGLFFRSLFWSLNVVLVFYTVLLYWLLYNLPVQHWSASMFMITLPVAWAFNLICLIAWLFTHPWRSLLSLLALVAGFWLWPRTVALNTPISNLEGKPMLSLLSYNVANFNSNDFYATLAKSKRTRQITDWIIRNEASVKCFQEFYNSQRYPALQMADRLRAAGYTYEAVLYPEYRQMPDSFLGIAIFSKFPILNQGREPFGLHTHNGIVWADIKIGADTVRIINVHLESMGIRVRRVLNQREMAGVRTETRGILGSLREGFIARREQVLRGERYIDDSPFPVIVAGDFNETPYSVVYGRLRARLNNAFEDAGQGFGFSLNRAPNLLRIDNQFYDANRLTALQFKTLREVPYSDHFPIYGEYVFTALRSP